MIGYQANAPSVIAATDSLVMAATGQPSIAAAWRSLVSPSDHIGIKIAAAGGRDFSTHIPVVEAVLRGLSAAGIPMSQVVIWDRSNPASAGYPPFLEGAAVRYIEPFTGYSPGALLNIPVVGQLIWGDVDFHPRGRNPLDPVQLEQYSVFSHWSRLVCGINKIINIPVMSASEDVGVAGCIYNVTIPNVDNWRRFVNPPQSGDPFLAEIYADEHIGPKVVLNIMDGLVAQFGGGPDWQPSYSWRHATLYAGRDPVALDATALRILGAWRREARLPPIEEEAKYLRTAYTMGLGSYPASQIQYVREER